VVFLTLPANP